MRKSDVLKGRYSSGGLFTSETAWQHSTRSIDTFELILVTQGTVYLQENGKEFELNVGEYLLLYPDRIHGGTRVSEMPVEFFWLHFAEDISNGTVMPHPDGLPQAGTLTNIGEAVQLVRRLLHYGESPHYPTACCDCALAVLLWELARQTSAAPVTNALAEHVHEYIRSHDDRLLTVADVEAYFGYNADYLSRVMKTYRGVSLQQDIIAERLDRAKLLLQTSNYTVERVARELGYEDPNLFVKFFRYHARTTPTAYRNTYTRRVTNHR